MTRSRVRRTIIGALTIACLAGTAISPAMADEVGGINDPNDDWNNNHQLCSTCTVNYGNVVGLWQNILYADGYLAICGSIGIDGAYGPNTGQATQDWKQAYGVGSNDRITGQAAWTYAGNHMLDSDGPGDQNFYYFSFTGTGTYYARQNSGFWKFIRAGKNRTLASNLTPTGHNGTIDFDTC